MQMNTHMLYQIYNEVTFRTDDGVLPVFHLRKFSLYFP